MNQAHLIYLEDLVRYRKNNDCKDCNIVYLLVDSLGGSVYFPETLIHRLKNNVDHIYTLFVNQAKSAATLLGLLSDKIITLKQASFGPVDPQLIVQIPNAGTMVLSARSIKDLIENTLFKLIREKKLKPEEWAPILAAQNYVLYQQALDALKYVNQILENHVKPKLTKEQYKKLLEKLLTPPLHGKLVTAEELKEMGLKVAIIEANHPTSSLIIEYHRRCIRYLLLEQKPGNKGLILFETKGRSMGLSVTQPTPKPTPATQPQQKTKKPEQK